MVKENPCTSGNNCSTCWHNDTCKLYLYRKNQQIKDQQSGLIQELNNPDATLEKNTLPIVDKPTI